MRSSLVVVALVIGALATAGSAFASDTIYWSNQGAPPGPGISFADLGGSGGGDLSTAGATSDSAVGVAIDAATGTVYWANANNNTISFASLAGGGGGQLNITGAVADVPFGVAIDPAQGRIYWTNISSDTDPIGYANLDGSGGANLNVTGATADGADGLAVDPVTGKVYWANVDNNTISYANLDGSGGGGQLNTAGVTPQEPNGVAIDSATGKLYWSNFGSDTHPISFADLDGSGGGGNLSTVGATASGAFGLALDPPRARSIGPTSPTTRFLTRISPEAVAASSISRDRHQTRSAGLHCSRRPWRLARRRSPGAAHQARYCRALKAAGRPTSSSHFSIALRRATPTPGLVTRPRSPARLVFPAASLFSSDAEGVSAG